MIKKTAKKQSKKPTITRQNHTIDATDQVVGRLATQIAGLLRGKNKPEFLPYVDMGDNVLVTNIKKLKFTGKKMAQRKYYHYSGYPGGLRTKKMSEVFETNPAEILKKAIWNMMPKNRLRAQAIKRLKITK